MLAPATTEAQHAPGRVGIGAQVGAPSGLTLKVHNPGAVGVDVLAAWDLRDELFLNAHALFEQSLGLSEIPSATFFLGPGAYVGVFFRGSRDAAVVGVSGRAGVGAMLTDRIEVYGQLTPRIDLSPESVSDFGGGIGVRVYL